MAFELSVGPRLRLRQSQRLERCGVLAGCACVHSECDLRALTRNGFKECALAKQMLDLLIGVEHRLVVVCSWYGCLDVSCAKWGVVPQASHTSVPRPTGTRSISSVCIALNNTLTRLLLN